MQALWETACRFLKKLKIGPPYGPAIPLLGVYQKKKIILMRKDTYIPNMIAAFFEIAKI